MTDVWAKVLLFFGVWIVLGCGVLTVWIGVKGVLMILKEMVP